MGMTNGEKPKSFEDLEAEEAAIEEVEEIEPETNTEV